MESHKNDIKTIFLANVGHREFNKLVDTFVSEKTQRDYCICVMIHRLLKKNNTFADAIKQVSENKLFKDVGERQIRNIWDAFKTKYIETMI